MERARAGPANPGIELPSSRITAVHRADASRTSFLWWAFLSRTSEAWREQAGTGKTLAWPIGVAEVGNEGVPSAVQRTRASTAMPASSCCARTARPLATRNC